MAASRKRAWLREELILALDLYVREGVGASRESIRLLSKTLRALPIEAHLAHDSSFRSEASVRRKLANFLALESAGTAGLTHGGQEDSAVWDDFAADPGGLSDASKAIYRRLQL